MGGPIASGAPLVSQLHIARKMKTMAAMKDTAPSAAGRANHPTSLESRVPL